MSQTAAQFLASVRLLVERRCEQVLSLLRRLVGTELVMPGKMLRTRLAARLVAESPLPASRVTVQLACAATEMVHSASLYHDDVIDGALVRRGAPALWKDAGLSGAVLIGDLLLCEALRILLPVEGGRYAGPFLEKVHQVILAETRQELLRGERLDEQTCLRVARDKTGPLFAFVGYACGGKDVALSAALEEAGYRIGTAYQLADDLLDLTGNDDAAGKTLGTDLKRRKFTLPQASQWPNRTVRRHTHELCGSALDRLNAWPEVREAVGRFIAADLKTVFSRCDLELAV